MNRFRHEAISNFPLALQRQAGPSGLKWNPCPGAGVSSHHVPGARHFTPAPGGCRTLLGRLLAFSPLPSGSEWTESPRPRGLPLPWLAVHSTQIQWERKSFHAQFDVAKLFPCLKQGSLIRNRNLSPHLINNRSRSNAPHPLSAAVPVHVCGPFRDPLVSPVARRAGLLSFIIMVIHQSTPYLLSLSRKI